MSRGSRVSNKHYLVKAALILGLLASSFPSHAFRSSLGFWRGTVAVGAALLSLLAGNIGGNGNLDGAGADARFNTPQGVAADSAGNLYVADQANNLIRKITPAGIVTTLAGTTGVNGSTNAIGTAASFSTPFGIASDSAGTVYVADLANQLIRKITPLGVVTTLAGTVGVNGSTNGQGTAASFGFPTGVAVDSAGTVYVADQGNELIRKITQLGAVTTLAGTAGVTGSTNAIGTAASFNAPIGIAVDSAGNNVYVADQANHLIRKITAGGLVTTLAGSTGVIGSTNATGTAATFNSPSGVAIDSAGNVYVADQNNNLIRKITLLGAVTTVVGTVPQFGVRLGPLPGSLYSPQGVAVAGGVLYVTTANGVVNCPAP
jgi:sugar lactone lactonase YvrE